MVVVPLALGLIFAFIFFTFRSMRQALVVYTGIPLAITGGVFALWLRDMPFHHLGRSGFHRIKRRGCPEWVDHDQLL